MKKIILIFFSFFLFSSLFSQDLIVTSDGDSLNCKIVEVTQDRIYYTIQNDNRTLNGSYNLSQIKLYKSDYFTQNLIVTNANVPLRVFDKFDHRRYGLSVGYGYLTPKLFPDIPYEENKDYINKRRKNIVINFDGICYNSRPYGFGGKANFSIASANTNDYYDQNYRGETFTVGSVSESVITFFVAPVFSYRITHNNRHAFFANTAVGCMLYRNNTYFGDLNYIITGQTIGLGFDLGYDFRVNNDLMLGIQVSYLLGKISTFNVDVEKYDYKGTMSLKKGTYEGLNRIDISIGLRF